jgi:hypothetical protein
MKNVFKIAGILLLIFSLLNFYKLFQLDIPRVQISTLGYYVFIYFTHFVLGVWILIPEKVTIKAKIQKLAGFLFIITIIISILSITLQNTREGSSITYFISYIITKGSLGISLLNFNNKGIKIFTGITLIIVNMYNIPFLDYHIYSLSELAIVLSEKVSFIIIGVYFCQEITLSSLRHNK